MSIEDFKEKIKQYEANGGKERVFMLLALLLTASLAFGLGRLSAAPSQGPITVGHFDALPGIATSTPDSLQSSAISASPSVSNAASSVFASKNGTKYYTQACKGGSRVSEANRIWFSTAAEAEKLGLTLASGCK